MSLAEEMQALAVGLVALLDDAPAITALTGRASRNVVRGWPRADHPLPLLAYVLGEAEQSEHGDEGENWDVPVVLEAIAPTQAEALALLAATQERLTTVAFDAVGLDAAVMSFTAGDAGPLADDRGQRTDRFGAQGTAVVWLTQLDPA